ncbi:hypothetical protein C0Q70_02299 [Pomacea canaliculata]|uniref:cellulase n=1 Tax=Pomacea canaliculata TaxID=400727 RepID=A0A2T7PPI0_POMCA|nr:hypothetical protein C0Q70_02299 [Pomacea canaliculata]
MLLSATLVVLLAIVGSEAAVNQTQTVPLQLSENAGADWEGQFCFQLAQPILAFEVVIKFNVGIKNVKNWLGTWLENEPCSQEWRLVNSDIHGLHSVGQFCVRVAGTMCDTADPSGTGTLVDLTGDSQLLKPCECLPAGAQQTKYNYAEVLQKSILFYEAQRSGKLPASNRIPWRGDSALQDRGDKGEDLTGGWYDAGDNVKFNFPMAFSTTMLCWSLLEFKDAYEKAGQLDYMYDSIRWPLEYFIKCHTGPNELYVQVGSGELDHAVWTSPERMNPKRPAYKIDALHPGSDVADETAAAMACGYLAFKDKDPAFATSLLTHSKQLYTFAKTHHGFYSDSVADAANFYKSYNYTDELVWGAAWMYKATGDVSYLRDAEARYQSWPAWGFSWDEKQFGNQILLYELTSKDVYKQEIISTMTSWTKAGGMTYTPKCLAWRLEWGSLRYAGLYTVTSLPLE